MKISKYNQVYAYLTRPGQDSNKAKPDNISSNKHTQKTSPGVKSLVKHNTMMKRVIEDAKGKTPRVDFKLAEAGFESSIPDVNDISKRLNQFRRPDDQLPTYDKDVGSFVDKKSGKRGALSNFKNEKIFEPILDRLKKPKPKSKIKIELQDSKPSLDMYRHIQEVNELKRNAAESETRFRELTKQTVDPDMYGGLAYLIGLTPNNDKGEE